VALPVSAAPEKGLHGKGMSHLGGQVQGTVAAVVVAVRVRPRVRKKRRHARHLVTLSRQQQRCLAEKLRSKSGRS
jgi:hypothetical protein